MATKVPVPAQSTQGKMKRNWPVIIIAAVIVLVVAALMYGLPDSSSDGGAVKYARWDYSVIHWSNLSKDGVTVEPIGEGNGFVVVTIRIVNDQALEISTNAFLWDYQLDGVSYAASGYTFAGLVNYTTAEVGQGGDLTFQLVYEIPANQEDGTVSYSGPSSSVLSRDGSLM